MGRRSRWLLPALCVVLLLVGLRYREWGQGRGLNGPAAVDAGAPVHHGPGAPLRAAAVPPSDAWVAAGPASAAAVSERARRLRDGWCGYGAPSVDTDRMAAVGRFSRKHVQEEAEILLGLMQAGTPGLEYEVESELVAGIVAAQPRLGGGDALRSCRASAGRPATVRQCLSLAEALWAQGNVLDRTLALTLVGRLLPEASPERAPWEPRARELEAVRGFDNRTVFGLLEEMGQFSEAGSHCRALPILRKLVRAGVANDWNRERAAMRDENVDVDALARQWREETGRSAFGPMKQQAGVASATGGGTTLGGR